ncbi:MAG: M48 family metalloprotease [Candidatus Pacebacteria bacterium]|nr:M48 family metalloprotease [Candidatus Paceibacterota bacterium]
MATLYTHQSSNVRKTWLLMSVFLVVVMAIGWGASWYLQNPSILYIAVVFALVMNVYSYWNSDKLVLSMTHAVEADPRMYLELHRIVENLAITAGLPKPRVFVVDDPAPNAFATGRDPEHGVVAVTTGILAILDRSELEGVLAHELSHIGNRDILVGTVAVVLAGFVAILSDFFLRMLWFGGGDRNRNMSPVVLVGVIIAAILAPIAATLIQLAVSRKREFLADASGALLTRYPDALASALMKISQHGREMQHASNATAHLFIANPFGPHSGVGASLRNLFSTHPPVEDRVSALIGKVEQ